METPIYQKLCGLKEEHRIPFHMPGHKRKEIGIFSDLWDMDITEIDGYDNLHHPEGIIRESMDELKKIYHTRESWYLINGSTVGILAAISSCCAWGEGILMSRNCHKSVYNAVSLLHLKAYYFQFPMAESYDILQDQEEEQRDEWKRILREHKEIKAIILPSPTYEGVVMDIAAIHDEIKEFDIPLIVDEAHGAHFIFHDYFPKSSIECGADIVIQSTHKTLPAMTQTALLHLCSDKISAEKISYMLSIYESSSPSYILLASAEYSISFMKKNVDMMQEYVDNLKRFREKCEQLQKIKLISQKHLRCKDYDDSKLVFSIKNTNINGNELFHLLLKKYRIELEMADCSNALAMTSICDSKADFKRLFQALKEIDNTLLDRMDEESDRTKRLCYSLPKKKMESWECMGKTREKMDINWVEGRIAGNFVMLYPPGIPLLVPGEKIQKETVENIKYYLYNGYNVLGLDKNQMTVLKR